MPEEKPCCGNCEYWRENPQVTAANSPILADNGERKPVKRGGLCLLRQSPFFIPQQNPFDKGKVSVQSLPFYDPRPEDEVCDRHPQIVEATLKGAIRYAIREWHDFLAYRPGKVPDTVAAGFTRVPTLAEAAQHAVGWKEKPDVPVNLPDPAQPSHKEPAPAAPAAKPAARSPDTSIGKIAKKIVNTFPPNSIVSLVASAVLYWTRISRGKK